MDNSLVLWCIFGALCVMGIASIWFGVLLYLLVTRLNVGLLEQNERLVSRIIEGQLGIPPAVTPADERHVLSRPMFASEPQGANDQHMVGSGG